jgi:hypothetical protein
MPGSFSPWLWCESELPNDCRGRAEFTGNRWNNVHLTLARKRAARSKDGGGRYPDARRWREPMESW